MSLKERIIKDTFLYAAANYVAMVIGAVVGIVTKAILGTDGAGYWAVIKVFNSYGEYSDLGTRNAMVREIPQAIGAGKSASASKTQDSAFAFTSLAALSSAAVIFAVGLTLPDQTLRKGLIVCAALVVATQLYNFSLVLLRTLKKVGVLSLVIVMNVAAVGALSVLGAWWKGVIGLALGVTLATFFSALNAYLLGGIRFKFVWDAGEIARLLKIGFPMVVISYALITFLSLDTLMIGKMIGIHEVGLYTIGLMSVQQVGSLSRFSQIIFLPHVQERYGRTGSLGDSAQLLIRLTRVLAYTMPFLIAGVVFLVPVMVELFLPRFIGGLGAMKILVVGYYFVAVNELSASAAFTADKQRQLIPFLGLVIALAAGLNWAFIRLGWGIEGVAAATAVSYALCFAVLFTFAFSKLTDLKTVRAARTEIIAVFAYFALTVYGIDAALSDRLMGLTGALGQWAVFCLVFLPVFWRIEKEEKIMTVITSLLRKRPAFS